MRRKGGGVVFSGRIHCLFGLCALFATTTVGRSESNSLLNGDFELETPTTFYYDNAGNDSGSALDIPGWEAFAIGDASSWVGVAQAEMTGNWVLNLSGSDVTKPDFVGLAGIKTAVTSRVSVTSGVGYLATVTYDNYFASAGISYFIDWFDAGGAKVSEDGGLLGDPNGESTFAPLTQKMGVAGFAPAGAVKAGIRFQSANGLFAGASADNFAFGLAPLLAIVQNGTDVVVSWTNGPDFFLQVTNDLAEVPVVWTDLGTDNPQTISVNEGNAFFRLIFL